MSNASDSPTGDDRCPACGGVLRSTQTDLDFVAGEVTVRVEGAPARTCGACGETFADGPLGVRIGDEVADVLACLRPDPADPADRVTAPRTVILTATGQAAKNAA